MTPKAPNGDRERALDELYAAPPDQFVETRKRLAKELRDAGHADAAAELRAARKPTVAASAINRAVRADSRKASDLIASARELRRAHAQALRGPGDRNFLRDAARQERAAATAMADAAAGILEREHGAPSAEVVRRIGETLDAVALDDEVMARFASGRLEREAQAAGLSLPVEADAEAAAPAPKRPKRPARDTERRREAERRSRAAERELSRARRAVEAKERALERTRGQLKRAQSGFEDAERDLRAAQAEFEEAKRKAAAARR